MPKQKGPTPQELYKARKEQEEIQRTLYFPPGLVNHGNTCFMNSVLQGLIATRYLRSLFQFSPLPPSVQQLAPSPIASWRSPLLTNGHGLGGKYEQSWEEDMPIGDSFVAVMQSSWDIQQNQRRESISPRDILSALGQKYDQYLDFRQQDAHEFLRQLLDAMRMEELDIIKKRQPPPPKHRKQRRRSTVRPPSYMPSMPSPLAAIMNHSLSQPTHPEDQKLYSIADMLFGGKLTSILVCQNCKHVSHIYEDFNDLSLSIKPEDYARDRKRDRLKTLAKKFKNLHGTALNVGLELQRSSSVPVSPRKSQDEAFADEPLVEEPRRRSLDYVEVEQEASSGDGDTGAISETYVTISAADGKEAAEAETETESKENRVEFLEPTKVDKKDKKVKDDDGWTRLGRRISMTVGLVKDKDQGSRPMDKVRGKWNGESKARDSETNTPSVNAGITMSSPTLQSSIDEEPSSLSPALPRLEPNRLKAESPRSASPIRAPMSPTISSPLPSISRFPIITRGSSPSLSGKRAKIHRPPKPTAEESAYLRQILADIAPPNSFGIFKPGGFQGTGHISSTATNLLLKMGQLPGIEECLRMFTAVEILDGENMVGCRRCWKIANGVYKPRSRPQDECEDSDSDESEKADADESNPHNSNIVSINFKPPSPPSSPSASVSMSSSITSLDAQSSSAYDTPLSSLSNDVAIPWQSTTTPKKVPPPLSLTEATPRSSLETPLTAYRGTTEAESPHSTPTTAKPRPPVESPVFADHSGLSQVLAAPLPVKDSLRAPRLTRHKRIPADADSTAESADESSDEALDSDASASTSMFSDSFSIPSASVSPSISVEQLPPVMVPPASKSLPSLTPPRTPPRTPRPKQVLMQPAYKRYLIAVPPPVLVIHLKRFQQLTKTPIISFSSGFKKLEDFVSFPECLDITPFLAPRKDDFRFGQANKPKNHSKNADRCMYRLYAVVVHIGNMLGGHYVAYTALPAPDSDVSSPNTSVAGIPTSGLDQSHGPKPDSTDNNSIPRKWAYISDTVVRLATLEEVLKAKAYICMYERI